MKRTLAILLATLLTLGVFAIGASAAFTPPAAVTAPYSTIYEINVQDIRPDPAVDLVALTSDFVPTMQLEATLALVDGYTGDATVADAEAANFVFYWYFGAVNDTAVPGGKQGAKFTLTDAEIDKTITIIALVKGVGTPANKIDDGDTILAIWTTDDATTPNPVQPLTMNQVNQLAYDLVVGKLEAVGLVEVEEIVSGVWYAEVTAAGADLADPLANLIAKYTAALNLSSTATAAQKKAAYTAYLNAVNALETAAQKFANDMFESVVVAVDDWLAFLRSIDGSKLSAKQQSQLVTYTRTAEASAIQLAKYKRAFNQYTKWEQKYTWAATEFAKIAAFNADQEFLRAIYDLGAVTDDSALKALQDQIKDLEKKIQDMIDNPTIIEKPVPGPTVVVEPKWYDLGIYKILGVGGWGDLFQTIVYYVFFGWRFGAK